MRTQDRPIAQDTAERPLLGILLRTASACCFAVMAMLLKRASDHGVTAPEMILYRNGFGLPLILAWVALGPGIGALATRRPSAHLVRAAIGLVSMALTFQALVLLPLAEATTITFAAPVFATILSALVLKEIVGRHRWLAVALGFAGVLVVMQPGSGQLPGLGIVVAVMAAIGQGAVAVTLRQISRSETTAAIVFWFVVTTTLAGAATLPWFGRMHDMATWALLASAGLLGGTGQVMMTASLRHAPVAVVAPFDYVQILWAILFGWLMFAHPLTPATLIGAAMVMTGGLLTAWRERHLRRTVSAMPADQ